MKAVAGQSSVEFAVGLATLALLGIGTLAIGTWQEAQRRVLGAARQAAFEELWSRAGTDEGRPARLQRLHVDDAGLAMPLSGATMAEAGAVDAAVLARPLQGAAGTAEGLLLQVMDSRASSGSGGFDPGGRGWTGAAIELRMRAIPFLPGSLRTLEPRLQGSMLLLDDSWSAAGPEQVAQRSGTLVPAHALSSLQGVVRPLLLPLSVLEPSLAHFCPGLLDADGVPEDRLSPPLPGRPGWNSCR